MLTDRNYWTTYKNWIAYWTGHIPPPAKLGMERVFEFARHIVDAAEREQVMRIVEVTSPTRYKAEHDRTWLEFVRARFEQDGYLAIFPEGGGAWPVDGEQNRLPARLAYYEGDRIVESEVEDVGGLRKALTSGKGGDEDPYYRVTPIALSGSAYNEAGRAPGWPPTREFPISLHLNTDIWFPRVKGLDVGDHVGVLPDVRHPARGRDGLMDNSALAACHTPRLNRFIQTLRAAILELGGRWVVDLDEARDACRPVLHDGGILLDYPAGNA